MVIAASIIAGRALAPIEGSIEGWNGFSQSRAAYDRVSKLMMSSVQKFEKLRLRRPEGRLNVERLRFGPAGPKQEILNGPTLGLNPGDSLAVIGNSGAVKTTLGNKDEHIHRPALLADVHDMIASLPHGYETMVAADGSPLSGGQKQWIARARAFFGNPRFLVLDEPNSNLDTSGDQALTNAIRHAGEAGITVVVITQKPSLLSVVDKIMLLADGNIVLFGERQQVLQKLSEQTSGRKLPSQGNGGPRNV